MTDTDFADAMLNDLDDANRFHSDYLDDPIVLALMEHWGIIGQMYPVSKRDTDIRPIYGLLFSLDHTLAWLRKQFWNDITITELNNFLDRNDILTSSNLREFDRMKDRREREAKVRRALEHVA